MKLLVTGATGFVGYHFTEYAVQKAYDVTCTLRETSDREALEKLGVQLITTDLQKPEQVDACIEQVKPDIVVHCAGCVVSAELEAFALTNIEGTRNICEASLKHGVERLVYLSSVDVNSANENRPITEDLPYIEVNAYGRSKIEAEKLVIEFQSKGLKSVILRPTTIIGEGEPHGIPQLLPLLMKRRLPFPKLPDLKDQIHIVYIGNLVKAIDQALISETAVNEILNICDEKPVRIKDMLDIMVEELACKPPRKIPAWLVKSLLVLPPLREAFNGIFRDWAYDIAKAQKLLAYHPQITSEEGLRRTVRYWKQHQSS